MALHTRTFSVLPSLKTFYTHLQLHSCFASSHASPRRLAAATTEKKVATLGAPKARTKRRLDELCLEYHPGTSRNVIQSWIAQGKVLVDDKVVTKAGAPIGAGAAIRITAQQSRYVCRAGNKLEAALQHFGIGVAGKRVLDAGISTGGFTDCLLQHGAAAVIGVDVGYGQVAERVRIDDRVTIMERTNVRYLTLLQLPGGLPIQLATLDLSFISVLKVMDAVCALMSPDAALLILIKPQFEAERTEVLPGGIVKDPEMHKRIVASITQGIQAYGFNCRGCIPSPVPGAVSGNVEFLAYFERTQST